MKSCAHIALAVLMASSALAENWPRFRGPNGQGISAEKNLPLHWNATNHIAWRVRIPGEGWSSPIVWNDQIFLTTTIDGGTKCHVIGLNARNGKILWDKEVFEQLPRRKEGKNSYATPTPTTDGQSVFATFGDGSVVALRLNGSTLWTNREVQFYSRHGLGASPIVYNGLVIQPYDGSTPVGQAGNYPQVTDEERTGWQIPWDKSFIAALDAKTGKRVWTGKRGLSRIAHVTPFILNVDGKAQLISGAGDRIQGTDPRTGDLLWWIYAQGEGVVPSPVVGDGMLFASSGFEKTTLRGVKLGGAKGDVTQTHVLWEQRKGVPTQPSPIYVKPFLYAITDSGGMVTCYKPETGDIVWQERIGGNFSASPVYADGKIYFLSETGETTVLALGSEFKVLAKNKQTSEKTDNPSVNEFPDISKCQSSMAISNGRLFIRTDKALYCIAN